MTIIESFSDLIIEEIDRYDTGDIIKLSYVIKEAKMSDNFLLF